MGVHGAVVPWGAFQAGQVRVALHAVGNDADRAHGVVQPVARHTVEAVGPICTNGTATGACKALVCRQVVTTHAHGALRAAAVGAIGHGAGIAHLADGIVSAGAVGAVVVIEALRAVQGAGQAGLRSQRADGQLMEVGLAYRTVIGYLDAVVAVWQARTADALVYQVPEIAATAGRTGSAFNTVLWAFYTGGVVWAWAVARDAVLATSGVAADLAVSDVAWGAYRVIKKKELDAFSADATRAL